MKPRYYRLSRFFEQKFGHRVWKVSVDAGFDCPNRGGCIFCDATSFSPSRRPDGVAAALEKAAKKGADTFRAKHPSGRSGKRCLTPFSPFPIHEQIDRGIETLRRRYAADRFVAYFQPSTNTYASVEVLREFYEEAISHPAVVGLIVGTRPDCVPDEVLELLDELAQRTWVSLELGLQTIHDRTLAWLGRGHDYGAFLDAVERCRPFAFDLGVHAILGLPGESREEVLAMADELTRLKVDSVKLHNLYAVRGTPLAEMVATGEVEFETLEAYVDLVVAFLERLRPECVVDRLSGEAPPDYLVGPDWCVKKAAVLQRVEEVLRNRDTWQGRLLKTENYFS